MRAILMAALVAASLAAGAAPALAQNETGQVDRAVVDRALAYLNSIKTLRARFIQRNLKGDQWTGEMWMDRPGRLRFQYDPPENDVIWTDNNLVKHYDAALETMTHLTRDMTPAWFLLDDPVRITDAVQVRATADQTDRYFVAATQEGQLADVRVTLAFAKNPERIIGWSVTEADGSVNQVDLIDARFGEPIPRKIFQYQPPQSRQ